ncbi:MFS transporter [Rothia sp. P7208]|uniref:MFS transporter n=1 Tax=Rothia sp. P7208 TaxID=3402660 RepID=UPI003ACC59F7
MNHKNKSFLSWVGESAGKEIFTVASLFTVLHSIKVNSMEFSILRIVPEIVILLASVTFTKISYSKKVELTLFQGYTLTGISYMLIFILYVYNILSFYSYLLLLIFAVIGRAFVNFSRESYIQQVIHHDNIGKHYSALYRISTICEIVVPLSAGYIVSRTSGPFGLAISGLTIFLLGALPFSYKKVVTKRDREETSLNKASISTGIQEILSNRPLLVLTIITIAFSSMTAAYGTGYYILIANIYNMPAEIIGILISAGAVSNLFFTYLIENKVDKKFDVIILISSLLLPLTLITALLPNILNSGYIFFILVHETLLGAIVVALSVASYTLRSKIIRHEDMQGVTIARSFLGSFFIPLTTLGYGTLSLWIGVIPSLVFLSAISSVIIPIAIYGYRLSIR